MSNGQEVAVCSRHDEWVSSCLFSRDSNLLVSVSNNIKVFLVLQIIIILVQTTFFIDNYYVLSDNICHKCHLKSKNE